MGVQAARTCRRPRRRPLATHAAGARRLITWRGDSDIVSDLHAMITATQNKTASSEKPGGGQRSPVELASEAASPGGGGTERSRLPAPCPRLIRPMPGRRPAGGLHGQLKEEIIKRSSSGVAIGLLLTTLVACGSSTDEKAASQSGGRSHACERLSSGDANLGKLSDAMNELADPDSTEAARSRLRGRRKAFEAWPGALILKGPTMLQLGLSGRSASGDGVGVPRGGNGVDPWASAFVLQVLTVKTAPA